ncbi:hypothetical protein HID58_026020 [Brassica napus]|uniref:Autophagy-related protein 101 n=1 Tax=Brassica napus TaxID=3708 RepID=A0ABQ8CMQ5_BRANA|nr:hypothetical protein HID58_026020 [Brassica napus]
MEEWFCPSQKVAVASIGKSTAASSLSKSIGKWNRSRYARFYAVQCGEIEVEKKIDETIEHFISWIDKHPNKRSPICVSFYEVKSKQPSWFNNKQRSYWEQWYVNLNVLHQTKSPSHHSKLVMDTGEANEERSSRRTLLEQSLQEVLFQIIKFVNEKKDHVPPINDGVIYCPFEITMPSSSDSTFGMDIFKRMLHSGGHPSMLS